MRQLTTISLVIALVGCAAPGPSPEQLQARHARLIAQYGPSCRAAGFPSDSVDFARCIAGYEQQERQANLLRAAAVLGQMQPIAPQPLPAPAAAVQCTTMQYGSALRTICQ